MSRNNKVNPDHYTLAGRLSADDLARERSKQAEIHEHGGKRRRGDAKPPWSGNERAAADRNTDRLEASQPRRSTRASGASGTPSTGKAPRGRGSGTAASPERAGGPRAHATAPRGRQKATVPKRQPRAAKTAKKR